MTLQVRETRRPAWPMPKGRDLTGLKICTRCIYDETVGGISFDADGVCAYCKMVDDLTKQYGTGTAEGESRMAETIEEIKRAGRGKKYDCVVGVSGGTDSTYMLLRAIEWGLRPLAVHYDNTWNTAIATENIRKALKRLKVDLYTHVVSNKESDDIIRAFFKASVPDLDCATDIALAETLYRAASKYDLKYVLEGHSFIAEGVSPLGALYMDGKYIESVHRMFGTTGKLKSYPNMKFASFMKWSIAKRIKKVRPLWYIDYSKDAAKKRIKAELDWQDYGGHHLENRITAFFHAYYSPVKFGIDNRNLTLAAQARAGLMSREDAIARFAKPPTMEDGIVDYFIKRLGLTVDEFNRILALPKKSYKEYPTYKKRFERLRPMFYVLAKAELVPMSFYIKYTSKSGI